MTKYVFFFLTTAGTIGDTLIIFTLGWANASFLMCTVMTLMSASLMVVHISGDLDDCERKGLTAAFKIGKMRDISIEQLAQEIELLKSQRDKFVETIAMLAGWVHSTKSPTNEKMRNIRHRLVKAMIQALEQGASVAVVMDNILPDAIRDVINAELKSGRLDLKSGAEWQRELVQFVYADKPACEPPAGAQAV